MFIVIKIRGDHASSSVFSLIIMAIYDKFYIQNKKIIHLHFILYIDSI